MARDDKKDKPKEEPIRATRLEIDPSGKDGKYSFDIQVISNKGLGLKSKIRITEGEANKIIIETDEQGFITNFTAQNFTEEKMVDRLRYAIEQTLNVG